MVDPLLMRVLIASLLSGVLVGISSPLLTLAKTLLTGLSMIHNVLAGGILAVYLYYVCGVSIPMIYIALMYVITVAILTAELVERGYPPDTAASVMIAISSAITVVLSYFVAIKSSIAIAQAWSLVVGTSSIVTISDISLLIVATTVVGVLVLFFRREIIYIAFDELGARSMGLNVRLYRYVLYTVIAILAITLTMTIGIIAAHITIAAPGALALQLSRRKYTQLSVLIALIITLGGYVFAYITYLPPSGGLGIFAAATLILSELLKVKR
ncbi:MAG: hypothetical protein DRO18_06405 [Thermoprotei archaeon]|nr:MAG: hypothetical protein DRO18_06405 [Thermoprotei archaeon]